MMPFNEAELNWLMWTTIATGCMWLPHILQLIAQEGFFRAVWDPVRETPHAAAWARRSQRAHWNAVENLVIFAPLVALVVWAEMTGPLTAAACLVFFLARVGHFLAYLCAVPLIRVSLFLLGWACQMVLAARLLGFL